MLSLALSSAEYSVECRMYVMQGQDTLDHTCIKDDSLTVRGVSISTPLGPDSQVLLCVGWSRPRHTVLPWHHRPTSSSGKSEI